MHDINIQISFRRIIIDTRIRILIAFLYYITINSNSIKCRIISYFDIQSSKSYCFSSSTRSCCRSNCASCTSITKDNASCFTCLNGNTIFYFII